MSRDGRVTAAAVGGCLVPFKAAYSSEHQTYCCLVEWMRTEVHRRQCKIFMVYLSFHNCSMWQIDLWEKPLVFARSRWVAAWMKPFGELWVCRWSRRRAGSPGIGEQRLCRWGSARFPQCFHGPDAAQQLCHGPQEEHRGAQ